MEKLARSFKTSFIVAAVGFIASGGISADYRLSGNPLTHEDKAWIDASEQIVDNPSGYIEPDIFDQVEIGAAIDDAEMFFSDLRRTNQTVRELTKAPQEKDNTAQYDQFDTYLFSSFSLDNEGLDDILELASSNPRIVVVFRGIPENMELSEGIRYLQSIAIQLDPVPNIVLDPTLFDDYMVEVVPTIIRVAEGSGRHGERRPVLARVAGLTEPAWLDRQIAHGETGDLGVRGPVAEVEERNLIEAMQERVLEIDWAERRERAIERFWGNQEFQWMPPATRSRERQIDPRVHVYQDIIGPGGELIAEQGQIINPLDSVPFNQAVIVMNASDKKEISIITRYLETLRSDSRVARITYITTELNRDDGWDSYAEVTEHFQAPLFLLTSDVKERFNLEYTPSIITSDGEVFLVRELTEEDVI